MSKALQIADKLAARLTATTALSGVPVIVDRQKDLAAELLTKVSKLSPACIILRYEGFSNSDASQSGRPTVIRRYTATVFALPIFAGSTGKLGDAVMEAAAIALHNWEPVEATDGFPEIRVTGGDYRPDAKFLIYDLDLEIPSKL